MQVNIGKYFGDFISARARDLAATIGDGLAAFLEDGHDIESTTGANAHQNELHGPHTLISPPRFGRPVYRDSVPIRRVTGEFNVIFPNYGSFHQKFIGLAGRNWTKLLYTGILKTLCRERIVLERTSTNLKS